MKIVTLLENTACREGLRAAHGLSLYIETPRRKLLFDMGPNEDFLANAGALGVDLTAVDLAVLSHGHYDHGRGLAAFCRCNDHAPVYIHSDAFGAFYALDEGRAPRYIGLPRGLEAFRDRFVLTGDETVVDDEFRHEQDLLIRTEGKAVLICGCAHRGVVNIRSRAAELLGRMPDAVIGGFHLFELTPGADADRLIDDTGRALLEGDTVYYTGHCTGPYAYERLSAILGDRLRPLTGGAVIEV